MYEISQGWLAYYICAIFDVHSDITIKFWPIRPICFILILRKNTPIVCIYTYFLWDCFGYNNTTKLYKKFL